jgi:prolyl-tRNA editing enzyme YbaK/EbsC (Cys-tRNA(Pro) deacylase)
LSDDRTALASSAKRVQDALEALGLPNRVIELERPVRTAVEAAAALGCDVAQIAKSLVFRRARDGAPLLIIASGKNRVDEHHVARLIGERIEKANAQFVRDATGFAIGGVAPLGHTHTIETLLDEDLMRLEEIWAAAGHPHALFRLTPDELTRMTGGRVIAVTAK